MFGGCNKRRYSDCVTQVLPDLKANLKKIHQQEYASIEHARYEQQKFGSDSVHQIWRLWCPAARHDRQAKRKVGFLQ